MLILASSFYKSYKTNKLLKIVQRSHDIWGGEEGLEEARAEKAEKRELQKQRKFNKKVKGEFYCCCSFFTFIFLTPMLKSCLSLAGYMILV